NALNHPKGRHTADAIGRDTPCPCWLWERSALNEPSPQCHDAQDRCDEEELADLDAKIEKQQRNGNRCLGKTDGSQRAGETESVQQAKGERDNPGPALCPALPALTGMHNLAGD